MDRLAESNLKAYITAGSTKAIDANTVEITLLAADGQFPYQVGPYNPQALITPVDYVLGTTLDKVPNGTGPFKLTKYDEAVGATFEANADYWDGKPFLDSLEFTFNEDLATLVSGMQAGEVDAIVQFSVIGGDALLADDNIEVGVIHGSAHRMLWMNTREGDFTDVRVRQAVALGIDRQALIDTILKGKGDIGNDHPIAPIYPYFDASQPQRTRDIEKAKQLLKDAGKEGLKATMFFPKLREETRVRLKSESSDSPILITYISRSLGARVNSPPLKDLSIKGRAKLNGDILWACNGLCAWSTELKTIQLFLSHVKSWSAMKACMPILTLQRLSFPRLPSWN